MPRLSDLLRESVGDVEPRFGPQDIVERAGRFRRRRRISRSVAAVATVALVATTAVVARDRMMERRHDRLAGGGVFAVETDTVLLFDDGLDGIVAVDLDRRLAVRRPIMGQRAGDQPFRLLRTGDSLIVGWAEVWAAPLDGGRPRKLTDATSAFPASEPGTVWVVRYPGGRIGEGAPEYRQLDLGGDVIRRTDGLDETAHVGSWGIGVRGGLAFSTSDGIRALDVDSGRSIRFGDPLAHLSDVHGGRLAWCDIECITVTVSDTDTGEVVHAWRAPEGAAFGASTPRFSPDGRLLAAAAEDQLVLMDARTGALRVARAPGIGEGSYLSWSDTGDRLFWTSHAWQAPSAEVGMLDVASMSVRRASLPFGGTISLVAVHHDTAAGLLAAGVGSRERCPAPVMSGSERSPCAFRF